MPVRFQVEGDFYDHPKTIGMSDAAVALWTRAGSYSANKLTDGYIAEHVLSILTSSPETAPQELVERGLWKKVKGGYRYHQWDRRNLTRSRVEAEKESDRQRKRRARGKQGQPENPQVNGQVVRPDSDRNPDGIPDLSVSVSMSESVSASGLPSGRGRKRPAHPLPDDWKPTDAHLKYVTENGLDGSREFAAFKAHAEANDRRLVNWNAGFTQWLLKARPTPRSAEPDVPHYWKKSANG